MIDTIIKAERNGRLAYCGFIDRAAKEFNFSIDEAIEQLFTNGKFIATRKVDKYETPNYYTITLL